MTVGRRSGDGRLRVVMPVHNAVAYVRDALVSVLADLPVDGEVVVVDDGSTDGSEAVVDEVARDDDRVTVIRHGVAVGVSEALNAGIRYGELPEFVAVAEHDDIVIAGRFAAQLAALTAAPELGAVSGSGRYLGPQGRKVGRVFVGPRTHEEFIKMRECASAILIPHPAITYRSAAVVSSGLYEPIFDSAQDLELLNRMVYGHGWEVRTLAGPHVLYRIHDSAMSFSHIFTQRMMTRYIVERNRLQMVGKAYPSFEVWQADNQPGLRTRVRWYRKDVGALRFRRAGQAWLYRRPLAFAGNLVLAAVLHPRWVLMKARVALGR